MAKSGPKWRTGFEGLSKAIVVLLLLSETAVGLELGGYYKNLLVGSETIIGSQENYWLDVNRLRLGVTQDWQQFDLELIYDNEIQTGTYLDTFQFRQFVELNDPRYWKWQGNSIDRRDVYGSHQVYRGTVKYRRNNFDLRVGRQQVNWATALIWNPLDLFNPISPLQLERDERVGVDAVLLDVSSQDLSRWSFVYAPHHESDQSSQALRFKTSSYDLDWLIMAGRFAEKNKAGIGLAGQAGMVGLRSEIVLSHRSGERRYGELVLSADYTTINGTSFLIEGYFNGDGQHSFSNYNYNLLIEGKKLGLARRYLGAKLEKRLTPLSTVELYAVTNLDDHSYYYYPSLNYSVPGFEDLQLKAGAQLFYGGEHDEFGYFNHAYYAELTLFY